MSRVRRFAGNMVLMLGALTVVALILEGVLAFLQINTRANLRFLPGKGRTFVPGAAYVQTKEGYSQGRFNSHGFRDRERTWEKPTGVFRIVVLGDSYVEAQQVDLDAAFPALLEDCLNARPEGGRYEAIALGQSGFGTVEDLVRYRAFARDYNPDVVLLAVTTSNDFRDNHRVLNRGRVGHYGVLQEDGGLAVDDSLVRDYERTLTWPKRAYQSLRRRSYLLSLVSERLALLNEVDPDPEKLHDGQASRRGGTTRLDPRADLNIYLPDAGPLWDEAYEITRRSILLLRDEVLVDGGRLAIVALTNAEQVHPEIAAELSGRYSATFDWERPNQFLASVAARADIPFLNLVPVLSAWHLKTGEYVHGFGSRQTGHWNETGHRLAAEAICNFVAVGDLVPLQHGEPRAVGEAAGAGQDLGTPGGSRYISLSGETSERGASAGRTAGEQPAIRP